MRLFISFNRFLERGPLGAKKGTFRQLFAFGRGHDWGVGAGGWLWQGGECCQINSVQQQVKLSAGSNLHPSELLHVGERQAITEVREQITIMADQLMALIH